ncbi:Ohr subfamily peroxiredoxin [Chitinimonas sp.]|uniref:Ohr subfamily peroxiredoxin n=1 Tax=Chitinimonas sp. TaxID=1934313 RepID=UPI002F927D4C
MYANTVLDSQQRSHEGTLTDVLALQQPGSDAVSLEQLFAAGYTNCFMKALKSVAAEVPALIPAESSITADVVLDQNSASPALDVELSISLPGLDREVAAALIGEAHLACPYHEVAPGKVAVRTVLL